MSLKLIMYDKFKNYFMPYDSSKYSNLQYYIRTTLAAICSTSFTFCLTYPLDTIHTRTAADLSPDGRGRNYNSTF